MDAAGIQNRIYRGYAKAAQYIGPSYQLFRPSSATNPFQYGPLGTLNASFNAQDMTYGKPNVYGKPLWFALLDGTQTQVGDYLTSADKTYFIAAMQQTLPILAVECNRTLNVRRPAQQSGVGALPYGGNTGASETPLMTGWPASVLQGTKGENEGVKLPGDVRLPWWAILLPAFPGVTIRAYDVMSDDLGNRYIISSAEQTDLGWRMTALQAQT